MKKLLRTWMILAAGLIGLCGTTATQAQGTVSFQVFYDELQPYGTWMEYSSYGYVWMPQVDRDFVPYGTNGYWVNTEYGNTWVSDYSWGWAPFHYGRWVYDDFYGWLWVPGNEWAPAWVAWRSGGGYYGWAPLMPGMGISVSFSVYNRIPNHCWNFVPYRYITYRGIYRHCVPRPRVVNIIHQTNIITYNRVDRHHSYFTGPSRHQMERDGRRRVDTYRIDSRNTPGRSDISRGAVSIYRPHVEERTRRTAVPSHVMRENEMRNRENPIAPQRERAEAQRQRQDNRMVPDRWSTQDERQNNVREHQQDSRMREHDQNRQQQENRMREQQEQYGQQQENRMREQQDQNRQQPENRMREQQDQNRQLQENRMREQQDQNRRQPENRMREQQDQNRQLQENQMREQQGQNRQLQENRMREQQDQNRQQQQMRMREQQDQNRQQQQQQQMRVREQQQQMRRAPSVEQRQPAQRVAPQPERRTAPRQTIRRETPSQNGGGSQRRRSH